ETGEVRLRAAGWVLLGYLGVSALGGTVRLYLLLLPFVLLAVGLHRRGLGTRPRAAGWLWKPAGARGLGTRGCGTVLKGGLFASTVTEKTNFWHPIEMNRYLHLVLDPFFQMLLCGGALLLAGRLFHSAWYHRVALTVGLGVQLGFFALLQTPWWMQKLQPVRADLPFVQEVLQPYQAAAGRTLTVYWPSGGAELLWLDLRVTSFVHREQLVGCLFSRPLLAEAQRRVALVERFEERWIARALLDRAAESTPEHDPATEEDLRRLCQEPTLDFVILEQDFGGQALA